MHDIELHFAEKEKRTQTRKLKRFLSKSKRCTCTCRDVIYSLVRNVNQQGNGNTLDWIIDHASLNQWLYIIMDSQSTHLW